MAFDNYLEERINQVLEEKKVHYVSKKMMGGLCYMVDDKMCVGIIKDMLMCRVGPDMYESCLAREYVQQLAFTVRPMKGYIFVQPEGFDMDEDLDSYIQLCLDYNPLAKSSKKRKK